jgi:general secretion pathway protein I
MSRASDRPRPDSGFSLVEALVALSVFALAGVSLVSLQTQSLSSLSRAERGALADLVAQNRLVEINAALNAPDFGAQQGDVTFAGRAWTWMTEVNATPDPRTVRIAVAVREAQSGEVLAQVVSFRPSSAGSGS